MGLPHRYAGKALASPDQGGLATLDRELEELLREEHAHRRLGFSHEQMRGWIEAAGLAFDRVHDLPPETADGLTVSLFLAADRRIEMADQKQLFA